MNDEMNDDCDDYRKPSVIYTKLKAQIRDNRLPPKERLQPTRIANRLKVSVTPVREALQRLATENLVVFRPNHGHFSKRFDLAEARQLYEIAYVNLEYAITKSIARRSLFEATGTVTTFPSARPRNNSFLAADLAEFIELVYNQIAQCANNAEFLRIICNFCDRTHALRVLDLEADEVARMMSDDVSELLDALTGSEGEKALLNLKEQFAKITLRLPNLVLRANAEAMAGERL